MLSLFLLSWSCCCNAAFGLVWIEEVDVVAVSITAGVISVVDVVRRLKNKEEEKVGWVEESTTVWIREAERTAASWLLSQQNVTKGRNNNKSIGSSRDDK
jgi:hypothetical protein